MTRRVAGRSHWRALLGISLGSVLFPGLARAQASGGAAIPQPFAVGELKAELAGADKIGSKRSGLLCIPAGALHWRDIEPSGSLARNAAARAIRGAGVAIDAPGEDDWLDYRVPSTGYRLIGSLIGVEASVCAPAYGLARALDHSKRLKGEVRMRIEWRVYRLSDHQVVARTETCAAVRFDRTGMAASDVGQLAVIENAKALGAALARGSRPFALPATLVAEGDRCPPRSEGHRTPDGVTP